MVLQIQNVAIRVCTSGHTLLTYGLSKLASSIAFSGPFTIDYTSSVESQIHELMFLFDFYKHLD